MHEVFFRSHLKKTLAPKKALHTQKTSVPYFEGLWPPFHDINHPAGKAQRRIHELNHSLLIVICFFRGFEHFMGVEWFGRIDSYFVRTRGVLSVFVSNEAQIGIWHF